MKRITLLSVLFILNFLISNAQNSVIMGTVNAAGSPITFGGVAVYEIGIANSPMNLVAQDTVVGGAFSTNLATAGNYIVVAIADTGSYPNSMATFYGDTIYWQEATIINLAANDTVAITINLKQLPNWTTGTGYCSGSVTYLPFQQRNSGNRAGDPVPGLDISLEQIPGGQVKANDVTDPNGFFEVKNIPMSTQYNLHVSLPGLEMDSTHNITIDTSNDTVVNLDFGVDTVAGASVIFPITNVSFINSIVNDETLQIYPNPVTNYLTLQLNENAQFIEIYNTSGALVRSENISVANLSIDVSELGRGVYFAKIRNGESYKTTKFIKL